MNEVDVCFGETQLGELFRSQHRGEERLSLRYTTAWLGAPERFALDPELHLDARTRPSATRSSSSGAWS